MWAGLRGSKVFYEWTFKSWGMNGHLNTQWAELKDPDVVNVGTGGKSGRVHWVESPSMSQAATRAGVGTVECWCLVEWVLLCHPSS